MIRVIIFDDHQLFIDGVINSFIDDPEIQIIGFANNLTNGIELLNTSNPDLIILDIDFSETKENGMDFLKDIRKQGYICKVLVLSGYYDKSLIDTLLFEGAEGYRLKNIGIEQLRQTIIDISNGEIVIKYHAGASQKNYMIASQLSERAIEIVNYLSKGYIVKEIAQKLGIAETTVNDHIERTKRKIGAKNNVELVFLSSKAGLI